MGHTAFESTIAVGVLVALLANSITMILIYRSLRRLSAQAEAARVRLEPVLNDVRQVVANARDSIGEMLREARASVRSITTSADEITEMATSQAREMRVFVRETVLMARNQVERLDHLLTRTTERIDDTAAALQHQVLEPARELNYLVAGIKRALGVFFARQRRPVNQVYQDEELFI